MTPRLPKTMNTDAKTPKPAPGQTRPADKKPTPRQPGRRGPRWTPEQIRRARQAPLLPLLSKRGLPMAELPAGNFTPLDYPGIIFKDSYWRWPQYDMSGNAIDFFVRILGDSFENAMEYITANLPA